MELKKIIQDRELDLIEKVKRKIFLLTDWHYLWP